MDVKIEEDYRMRPLINLLDPSTGSTGRLEQRVKIADRILMLLQKRPQARKEFLAARGVEATVNALDDYDCRVLCTICVQILGNGF
jgi:hypothetical protein